MLYVDYAERICTGMEPPSTIYASNYMFIMLENLEGILWYVAYDGKAIPNKEGQ